MNKALRFFGPRSSIYVSGYSLCTPLGFKSKSYLLYWLHICNNIESLPDPKVVIKMIKCVRERKAGVYHIEIFILTLVIWMLLTLQVFLDIMHQWGWHRSLKQLRDQFRKVIPWRKEGLLENVKVIVGGNDRNVQVNSHIWLCWHSNAGVG